MGQHIDALIDQELCILIVVNMRENLEMPLVRLIDYGRGYRPRELYGGAAAVVDHNLDHVHMLVRQLANHRPRFHRVFIEFETPLRRIDARALNVSLPLRGPELQYLVAIAA